MKRLARLAMLVVAVGLPLGAQATLTVTVPEPGSLSLLAVGIAGMIVIAIRKHRK